MKKLFFFLIFVLFNSAFVLAQPFCPTSDCATHVDTVKVSEIEMCATGSSGNSTICGDIDNNSDCSESGGAGLNCRKFVYVNDLANADGIRLDVGKGCNCQGQLDSFYTEIDGVCENKLIDGTEPYFDLPFGTNDTLIIYLCDNSSGSVSSCNICAIPLGALPVELTSWKGKAAFRANILEWTTASESDLAAFIMERSGNGRAGWQEVGRANAAGFSNEQVSYKLMDESPLFMGYYRLRTLHFDGTYEFSDLIAIERDREVLDDVTIFPNPITGNTAQASFSSTADQSAKIVLSNLAGNEIWAMVKDFHTGLNAFNLDLADLPEGVYFLRIEMPDGVIGKKIVLLSKD